MTPSAVHREAPESPWGRLRYPLSYRQGIRMTASPEVPLQMFARFSDENRPATLPANHFHFAFTGTDIQLIVGYIDGADMAQTREDAMRAGKPQATVLVETLARIAMSPGGFFALRSQMRDIERQFTPLVRRVLEEYERELNTP